MSVRGPAKFSPPPAQTDPSPCQPSSRIVTQIPRKQHERFQLLPQTAQSSSPTHRVAIDSNQDLMDMLAEGRERQWVAFRAQLPEQFGEPRRNLIKIHGSTMVEESDRLIQDHELRLCQGPVGVQIVQSEELLD
eukprot:CAMPEP_0177300802 /NCGR_PEP_ID=MMETSP0368-20130122/4736_1 /TAXON_ID=447022 ORGANISM="Scrippsiella hangoei-like, Strain SHHI-4" /NCGR_SAMPLE_ID=MMETSP0368 /ASSEMBLY_ACC=CAM_ASM_000363 /LENGTH=133 /DNA_ID=CAMNT_0018759191 /DNA_START=129 /DNA_END=531 /DNA_ORIENTATION=+